MLYAAKALASHLPLRVQQHLKRLYHGAQLRRGSFFTDEQEFALLGQWVSPGDIVLDIGANIGHYTARLSSLVGPDGRVVAFEPMIDTFELLAANVARLPLNNVTLVSAAVSNRTATVGMSVPAFSTGLTNYYMAKISEASGDVRALSLSVDGLNLPGPVTFAKVDVEGHELQALEGMRDLLARDHPTLVVEGTSDDVARYLADLGYGHRQLERSSNRIFIAPVSR